MLEQGIFLQKMVTFDNKVIFHDIHEFQDESRSIDYEHRIQGTSCLF